MNNGRDCEHGRQVGKCDSCDLIQAENTIARLLAGKWNGDELKAISSTKVIADIRAESFNDGGSAQKAFWEGFERGAISDNKNIREHWNCYLSNVRQGG